MAGIEVANRVRHHKPPTGEFVQLVGIAIIIALPISFYFTQNWLNGFAYRYRPGMVVFYRGRSIDDADCIIDGQLPVREGGADESGGELEE